MENFNIDGLMDEWMDGWRMDGLMDGCEWTGSLNELHESCLNLKSVICTQAFLP